MYQILIQSIHNLLKNLPSPVMYCHLVGALPSEGHFTILSSQLLWMVGNMVRPMNSMRMGPQLFCSEMSSLITSTAVCNAMLVDKAFRKSMDFCFIRSDLMQEGHIHIYSKCLFQLEQNIVTSIMEAIQCNQPATNNEVIG